MGNENIFDDDILNARIKPIKFGPFTPHEKGELIKAAFWIVENDAVLHHAIVQYSQKFSRSENSVDMLLSKYVEEERARREQKASGDEGGGLADENDRNSDINDADWWKNK